MTAETAIFQLKQFKKRLHMDDTDEYEINTESIDMAIKALEQEPKTGHWIFDKEKLGYWISTCSECEHIFHGDELLIYKPKYCANCGAKMESAG